jgi:hypothetical protein
MDKQKVRAAQRTVRDILKFMVDNDYIDQKLVDYLKETGDIDRLTDEAYYQISVSCTAAIKAYPGVRYDYSQESRQGND